MLPIIICMAGVLAAVTAAATNDNEALLDYPWDDIGQDLLDLSKGPVSDCDLPVQIDHIAAQCAHNESVRRAVASVVTPQSAMGVYHRLTWARSLSLDQKFTALKTLCAVFPDLTLTVMLDPEFEDRADELVAVLPLLDDKVKDLITDSILDAICSQLGLSSPYHTNDLIRKVRRTLPDPFKLLYPSRTDAIAGFLMANYPKEVADHRVVQALWHVGVRFELWKYLDRVPVPASAFPDIFPLLIIPSFDSVFNQIEPWAGIGRTTIQHGIHLLQIPFIEQIICQSPHSFITKLSDLIRDGDIHFFNAVLNLPYKSVFINPPNLHDRNQSLLYAALKQNRLDIARMLLTDEDLNMFETIDQGDTALDLIFSHREAIFQQQIIKYSDFLLSPEFYRKLRQQQQEFVEYLSVLIADDRDHILKYFLDSEHLSSLIRDHKAELLKYTKSRMTRNLLNNMDKPKSSDCNK